jgi:cell division protein FtsQ
MAYLNPPFRFRPPAASGEPALFQRGLVKAPVKRVQRTLVVRPGHIAAFFLLIAAIFLGLAKGYLLLITTSEFDIQTTRVESKREFVAGDIRALADPAKLGNLLALDIGKLERQVESHPWVREARLRKVFPSEVLIEITEREPAAVLKSGESYLVVAEDGVVLGRPAADGADLGLPLLTDGGRFQDRYHEKLALAWRCLKSLTAEELASVESLDVTRLDSPGLTLKGQPTRIILGPDRFSEELREYIANKDAWEIQSGPLEYVDLRFDDRVYLKPLPPMEVAALNLPREEAE